MGSLYSVDANTGNITTAGSITAAGAISSISGNITLQNQHSLIFDDTGIHSATISAPTTISSSYTLKLPTAQGAASTFLQNDGSGNLSWVAGGSGSSNPENLLTNGGFEYWTLGTGPFVGAGVQTANNWYIQNTSGAAMQVWQNNYSDIVLPDQGRFAIYMTYSGAGTGAGDVVQDLPDFTDYAGQSVSLSIRCRPYQLQSGQAVYAYIDDGVGSTQSTSLTSSGGYNTLTVTRTININPSRLRIGLHVPNGPSVLSLVFWDAGIVTYSNTPATSYVPPIRPLSSSDLLPGVSGLTGSGTTNTIPKFTSSTVVGNSNLTDTGSLLYSGNARISGNLAIGSALTGVPLIVSAALSGPTGAPMIGMFGSSGGIGWEFSSSSQSGTFSSTTTIATFNTVRGESHTVYVSGRVSGKVFSDNLLISINDSGTASAVTVWATNSVGSPTARTYTMNGTTGQLQLLMSGNVTSYQIGVMDFFGT